MPGRAVNAAKPKEVAQLLAHLHPALDEARLFVALGGSYEDFIDRHAEFLVQLLQITVRPTTSLVKQAVALAFNRPNVGSSVSFATMVSNGVAYARRLLRNSTTGAKVAPATLRVLKALQAAGVPGKFQRRTLARRASGASSAGVPATQQSTDSMLELLEEVPSPVEVLLCSSGSEPGDLDTPAASSASWPASSSNVDREAAILASYGAATPAPPTSVEYLTDKGLVRATPRGAVVAAMSRGPRGFAYATFPGERPKLTDFPNLCLGKLEAAAEEEQLVERTEGPPPEEAAAPTEATDALEEAAAPTEAAPAPKAAPPKKRPAAAAAPPLDPVPCRRFRTMYYKSSGSYGVRAVGGSQVLSVAKKGVGQDKLRLVAEGAVLRLQQAVPVEVVKAWVAGELAVV